ncbi:MAG: general secretion pathway protein GspK [Sedimentisphaerales bacterium]|nr:general secretion pathway protein GspK [Sedimentisphaerales bacterium]
MKNKMHNKRLQKTTATNSKCTGTVLIVTIWIVLILAGLVLVLSRTIRVDAIGTANRVSAMQAEAIANGAIAYVLSKVTDGQESDVDYGAPSYEEMQLGQGYFWVIRPNLSDDKNHDYGLTDEAGKINLNSASLEMLLKLPSMTSELANAIIDWRDSDSEISPGGAESEYYLLLNNPYNCKNSLLETVEEVLLVKGGQHDYLYGEDLNRNGVLEWNENDAQQSPPSDNSNGKLDPGFLNYVTVYSYEISQGSQDMTNVNSFRSQGDLLEIIREVVSDSESFQIMDNIRAGHPFQNLIDFYFKSGIKYESVLKIEGKLTTSNEKKRVGLVNINTAPAEVLLCLPGLEQSDVDAIVVRRSDSENDTSSILWLTKILSKEKAVGIGSYITTKSYQYGADIVVVSGDGRAFRRYYVVIDNANSNARVIYRQPLTYLGWPLDEEILQKLRNKG